MVFRLGCLFVLVPLVELVILIRLGQGIGAWPTIGLVAATGMLGAVLAKREGLRVLTAVRAEMGRGRVPARELLDGAAVLVGGALLLTPGIVTDVAGLALLLPTTRGILIRWARRRIERALRLGTLRVAVWGPGTRGSAGRRPEAEGRTGEIVQDNDEGGKGGND